MTMQEALRAVGGAWCEPATRNTVMDAALAGAFARILIRECAAAAAQAVLEMRVAPPPPEPEFDPDTPIIRISR